eukprot:4577775-Prymnesium_polylepis.1
MAETSGYACRAIGRRDDAHLQTCRAHQCSISMNHPSLAHKPRATNQHFIFRKSLGLERQGQPSWQGGSTCAGRVRGSCLSQVKWRPPLRYMPQCLASFPP